MLRLGFIDFYLNEWHANHYPDWLRQQAAGRSIELELGYAWAETEKDMTTQAWCQRYGMRAMETPSALIDACDGILVLSPDHPQHHERLGRLALMSGKPVYMDKTFAPGLEAGRRMFDLAAAHGTPLFSSSALRFSRELEPYRQGAAEAASFCAVTGPGVYDNYSVHQLEMINTIMGCGARRVKALEAGAGRSLWIDFGGRAATMTQTPAGEFGADIVTALNSSHVAACSEPFEGLIDAMLTFFTRGEIPVTRRQTLEVIALRDAGLQALQRQDTWIEVADQR
jgi:hypothetical protein